MLTIAAAAALPALIGDYAIVIATEIAIAALFAASLHFGMGLGGIISFGHAAFFGLGAYSVALAVQHTDAPFAAVLLLAPIAAGLVGLLVGRVVLRSHGVYAAMLTLAFAQILWSTAVQWVDVTGGDNGLLGLWSGVAARVGVADRLLRADAGDRRCVAGRIAPRSAGPIRLRSARDARQRAAR